jgi:hypothetical protein
MNILLRNKYLIEKPGFLVVGWVEARNPKQFIDYKKIRSNKPLPLISIRT